MICLSQALNPGKDLDVIFASVPEKIEEARARLAQMVFAFRVK